MKNNDKLNSGSDRILGSAVLLAVAAVAIGLAINLTKNDLENEIKKAKRIAVVQRSGGEGIVIEVLKHEAEEPIKVGDRVPLFGRADAAKEGRVFLQLWDGRVPPSFFMELRISPEGRLVTSGYTVQEIRQMIQQSEPHKPTKAR